MAWVITDDKIADLKRGDKSMTGYSEDHNRVPVIAVMALGAQSEPLPKANSWVKFRLYDDDGNLYYKGICHDDEGCENQLAALTWGEGFAGCTEIKVKRGDSWVYEIG